MLDALRRVSAALFLTTTLAANLRAQAPLPASDVPSSSMLETRGRDATISLLTMGNGEQVWEMFGHAAIWIHNNATGKDTVFNWGAFDMTKPNFILHFLQGLNFYQMAGETLSQLLANYRYMNRSVVSQELDLSEAQRDSLLSLIRVNARPENLEYRYDYFVENCSTRPRDMLDRALGGQLRAHADSLTGTTYRSHALRLMQSNKPLVVGVDIGLGEPSDVELTRWQTMFLPRELHDFVAHLQVRDSAGAMHPLVRNERVLFQDTRGPEAAAPPRLWSSLLLIGLGVAAVILALVTRAARSGAARVGLTIFTTLWCTIAGLLGVVLTILWVATDHRFAHANENLLVFNPLWLVLAVLVAVYFSTGKAARFTGYLAAGLAALCVIALLGHLVMLSRQANLAIILLGLPAALVIAWITWTPRHQTLST